MLRTSLCIGVLALILGCSSSESSKPLPKTVPGAGKVTLDGKPLSYAVVTFSPRGKTAGIECVGETDAAGEYELKQIRGSDGVPPGEYVVIINRYVKSDGTPVSVSGDVAPANVGAVESLPPRFSSFTETTLTAKVGESGGAFDFNLTSQ